MANDDFDDMDFGDDVGVQKLSLKGLVVDVEESGDSKQLQKTIKDLEAKVKAEPQNDALHAQLAKAYFDSGADDHALDCYTKAISLNPKQAKHYQGKAAVHLFGGDVADAQELLVKALEIDPNNSSVLFDLGKASQQQDDGSAKSQDYFRKALEKDPKNAKARFEVALYTLNKSESKTKEAQDQALDMFRQVIADDPKNTLAFYNAGQILHSRMASAADIKEAAGYFAKAAELDASDAQYRARLIQCYDYLGLDKECEAARAALFTSYQKNELNPNFTAIGKYCCSQFEVGDKFVMAFEHLKLLGPEPAKFVFNVFKKGEVHEDKVLRRIVLASQAGGYELAVQEGASKKVLQTYKGDVPALHQLKQEVKKVLA